MKKTALFYLFLIISVIPITLYMKTLLGQCDPSEEWSSAESCTWERSDGRCNNHEDCCPGRECSAFGMCQSRN